MCRSGSAWKPRLRLETEAWAVGSVKPESRLCDGSASRGSTRPAYGLRPKPAHHYVGVSTCGNIPMRIRVLRWGPKILVGTDPGDLRVHPCPALIEPSQWQHWVTRGKLSRSSWQSYLSQTVAVPCLRRRTLFYSSWVLPVPPGSSVWSTLAHRRFGYLPSEYMRPIKWVYARQISNTAR